MPSYEDVAGEEKGDLGIPRYEDVEGEERRWTILQIYQGFAEGHSDIWQTLEYDISPHLAAKLRRHYWKGLIQQLNKLVLENGTVIPLSEKQSVQVQAVYLMAQTTFKWIHIPGYPRFQLKDILGDAEKIAQALQTELNVAVFPQPQLKMSKKHHKVDKLA